MVLSRLLHDQFRNEKNKPDYVQSDRQSFDEEEQLSLYPVDVSASDKEYCLSDTSSNCPAADSCCVSTDDESDGASRLHFDLSMMKFDEMLIDEPTRTPIKTPAGFYERSSPFFVPSVPPLFEYTDTWCSETLSHSDSQSLSDVERSSDWPCADYQSSSDDHLQTSDYGSLSPTTSIDSEDSLCLASTQNEQMSPTTDESRICDELICSVLSHVDDTIISSDRIDLLDSCADDDATNQEVALHFDKKCDMTKSVLNPLAPSFEGKVESGHAVPRLNTPKRVAANFPCMVPVTFCSAVPVSYSRDLTGWKSQPTSSMVRRPRSGGSKHQTSKQPVPVIMHYTPLCDGTAVWTQFSQQGPVPKYTPVFYHPSTLASPFRPPVCIIPQPCVPVPLVNVEIPVIIPVNNRQLPLLRKGRTSNSACKPNRGAA